MKKPIVHISLLFISFILISATYFSKSGDPKHVRQMVDTVGFAHLDWQVDSVMNRINRTYATELISARVDPKTAWRVAICPHDDYTYASWQYPAILRNIEARTVIIFGVAHKARQLGISDRIVFDSYPYWHGPYGKIKVSPFRGELIASLPK